MNVRRWLSLVASLVLVSGACGDEKAEVLTPDELGSALLTPGDVGDGFVEDQRMVAEERPEDVAPLDPGMWCDAAGDAADELLTLVGEGVAFIQIRSTDVAQRNFHGVSEQLWSSPDAAAFVERATVAIEACAGETWIAEDDEATVTAEELAGEDVGDDSTTVMVTYVTPAPDGDYAWRGRTLLARFDDTVMVLQELDVQLVDGEPFFSDADWQRIVNVAVERVEALSDE